MNTDIIVPQSDKTEKWAEEIAFNIYNLSYLYSEHHQRIRFCYAFYNGEINQLYDERDWWIMNYVNKNYREPFEDRDYEILSEIKIDL